MTVLCVTLCNSQNSVEQIVSYSHDKIGVTPKRMSCYNVKLSFRQIQNTRTVLSTVDPVKEQMLDSQR